MIIIDESGDLTVTIIEYEDQPIRPRNRAFTSQEPVHEERIVRKTEDFLVCRQTLVDSSPYFKVQLATTFAEARQSSVTQKEDVVRAMEIWFRAVHNTIIESTYDVPLSEMWNLIAAADKYEWDIRKLNEWFVQWHKKNSKADLDTRQLVYPCYRFDHAAGFAQATKALAYNSLGHIEESNPTKHYQFHLPPRIIQQINAAKGRLRTVLHSFLFKPNESLLQASCTCKEKSLFGYEKALYNLKVWPLERIVHDTTMATILDRLEGFTYKAHDDACVYCQKGYTKIVRDAAAYVRKYFDGLCLDCIKKSKTGDKNMDYWRHNSLREFERVIGCRFTHSQATWYFSFMGRKEDRDHFRKLKRAQNYRGRHSWSDADDDDD